MTVAEARFAADAMLQSLANWLRLLGYDCLSGSEWHGRLLADRALADDRILLTRNLHLAESLPFALNARIRFYLVRAESLPAQLREVVRHFDLEWSSRAFTRCVRCNCPLRSLPPSEAASVDLPPAVASRHHRFWHCDRCGRTYWEGSQVQHIRMRLEDWLHRPSGDQERGQRIGPAG